LAKRVLIADDDAQLVTALRRTIQRAGFTVDVVGDGKSAAELLLSGAYDALVTDWMMPGLDGIELVRQSQVGFSPLYVAVISGLDTPAARAHALAAGANDFFPKPFGMPKIAPALLAWFDRQAKEPAEPVEVYAHPLLGTTAWRTFSVAAHRILSATVRMPLDASIGSPAALDDPIASAVPLADVEHSLDLRVVVETSRASAAAIHRALLGDVDAANTARLAAVLAELANMIGGEARTAFLAEGYAMTMGLPRRLEGPVPEYAFNQTVWVRAPGVDLVIRLGAKLRGSEAVAASDLREGMVLGESLYAGDGTTLLFAAGTRLTETSARSARQALDGRTIRVVVQEGA
jgi:CheY-like chemotaxis protein